MSMVIFSLNEIDFLMSFSYFAVQGVGWGMRIKSNFHAWELCGSLQILSLGTDKSFMKAMTDSDLSRSSSITSSIFNFYFEKFFRWGDGQSNFLAAGGPRK